MKLAKQLASTLLLTFSIGLSTAYAQAPEKMSYQAVIRNAGNNLITNQAVGMQISILQTTATGVAVYVETQTPATNANGLVSLEIGTGTVVSGNFATIDWGNDTYFIKTETDPAGGINYTIIGASQFLSVPYALHSKTTESITGTITEFDPVFVASVANGITAVDTANWNSHTVDTDTHLDSTGVAGLGFVAGAHTIDTDTQLDSIGIAGLGYSAGVHTINTDAQTLTVSQTGDTLTISGGNSVLVPGISVLNFPPPPAIGDFRDGGVVFYIDGTGEHGLICAVDDQSSGIQWYNGVNTTTNATGIGIGSGLSNTTTIVNNQGAGSYAAKLCGDLTHGGYSDWYLPSRNELGEMNLNKSIINTTAIANGGSSFVSATSVYYWSSSESTFGNDLAYAIYFNVSYFSDINAQKSTTYRVRAIRAF